MVTCDMLDCDKTATKRCTLKIWKNNDSVKLLCDDHVGEIQKNLETAPGFIIETKIEDL